MSTDTDLYLIRETLSDGAGPSLQTIMDARATLLVAIDAEAGDGARAGHGARAGAKPAPRRGRRATWRAALILAVGAVAVLAVVSRLWPASTQSAWAQQALRRAAAVVIPPPSPHTILHVAFTATLSPRAQRASHTTVSSVSEDAWLQQGPPWDARTIVHPAGGPTLEQDSHGDIYNMTSNELYPGISLPNGKPRYSLLAGPKHGTFRLRVELPSRHGYTTSAATAATARSLRDGSQQVAWAMTWNGHVQRIEAMVVPSTRLMRKLSAEQPAGTSVSFAPELRALLYSGHARVTRATTVGGQPAIEIAALHPQSGPRTIYYVNPKTYAPIELDIYGYDSIKDVTRVRITIYRTLKLAGHQGLLRFTVAKTARTDRNGADYWHASGLMNVPL
jgi:hypothetical protein